MREDQDFSVYSTVEPHLITQAELNNLFWGLDLPKTKAEVLESQLQRWNLLEKGVKVSFCGKRQLNIAKYFSMDGVVIWYTATTSVAFFRPSSTTHSSRP
jgi:dolichyl-phosphate-mannose--protein O-mannosyl transferase